MVRDYRGSRELETGCNLVCFFMHSSLCAKLLCLVLCIASCHSSTTATKNETAEDTARNKGRRLWHRRQANATRENDPNSSKTTKQHCSNYKFVKRKMRWLSPRQNRETKTAYRMAVLAALAYVPFHRQQRPEDERSLGFRLVTTRERSNFSLRVLTCRLLRALAWLWRHVLRVNQRTMRSLADEPSCRDGLNNKKKKIEHSRYRYTFDYWLFDWFEPTAVPGVNYHDTDLLVSTSHTNNVLALTFAGTDSAADHATNIQTFEKANHSGLFGRGGANNTKASTTIEGSLHRGFLNAYSRVDRGMVMALSHPANNTKNKNLTGSLYRRFGHCRPTSNKENRRDSKGNRSKNETTPTRLDNAVLHQQTSNNTTLANRAPRVKIGRKGICRSRGEKLMTILEELVTDALTKGRAVHLSGHSLGKNSLVKISCQMREPELMLTKYTSQEVALLQYWHSTF